MCMCVLRACMCVSFWRERSQGCKAGFSLDRLDMGGGGGTSAGGQSVNGGGLMRGT